MELNNKKLQMIEYIKKYRYVLVVLIIGIGLMLLPNRDDAPADSAASQVVLQQPEEDLAERLEQVLGTVSGAGRIKVLLTLETGPETLYQADRDGAENGRITTVTVTDAQRNEVGLINQILSPGYRGAVVVCQGADNAAVRLAIVEAVANATGLRTDKISVLKMK